MIDIPIDFETYRDKQYSLHRITTTEYICDPRFEIIGVALRTPDGINHWVSGDVNHVRSELLRLVPDWSSVRVRAHNARFEAAILEWQLDIKPAAYLCTMVGSRPHLMPYTRSVSLDAIGRHLGVGVKGDFIHKIAGKHRSDLTKTELEALGEYALTDVDICDKIADYLVKILPTEEQEILDLTIKKFVRTKLRLNRPALAARLENIKNQKELLGALLEKKHGATLADIRSRTKFAALLMKNDVTAPMKINKNGKPTYAFAKNDLEFKKFLAHPNPAIRELVSAKIALSSTMEKGRIRRLISIHDIKDGWLPVPLVYYGTHPGRLSGDDEINLQNLPRVEFKNGTCVKGHLRFAVEAPHGYSVVVADFSNIEARIVATLAGEIGLREAFRQGRDAYAEFASRIYGRLITDKKSPERFVGKTCILGLNYGLGWHKFALKLAQEGIDLGPRDPARIVRLYRDTYPGIPTLWRKLEYFASRYMVDKGAIYPSDLAGVTFAFERMILPNEMPIVYTDLNVISGGTLSFRSRVGVAGNPIHTWGASMLENLSQALARIIATRAELKLARRNLPCALQVHDELVWVVPTALVDKVKKLVASVMVEPVDFLPDLPIAVEVKHGPTYGDAK
jgi:DNA polymerase I-like protein with 3'-5' exonuclease and polymerase domains